MKCLMADEANEYKQEIHLISWANQLTKSTEQCAKLRKKIYVSYTFKAN